MHEFNKPGIFNVASFVLELRMLWIIHTLTLKNPLKSSKDEMTANKSFLLKITFRSLQTPDGGVPADIEHPVYWLTPVFL